jgi:hypothetical protein
MIPTVRAFASGISQATKATPAFCKPIKEVGVAGPLNPATAQTFKRARDAESHYVPFLATAACEIRNSFPPSRKAGRSPVAIRLRTCLSEHCQRRARSLGRCAWVPLSTERVRRGAFMALPISPIFALASRLCLVAAERPGDHQGPRGGRRRVHEWRFAGRPFKSCGKVGSSPNCQAASIPGLIITELQGGK